VALTEEFEMRVARAHRRRFTPRQDPIVYKAPRVGGSLIGDQLRRCDFRNAYQVVVLAQPEAVYAALARLDFLAADLTTLGAFAPVAERRGREIVLGAVGRPWRRDAGPVRIATSDFAGFSEPGFAKIAWSWIVKPLGSGQSLLVVEWRTQLTDDDARAQFERYWPLVSRGVRRLARTTLGRIKAACERDATPTIGPS
jgi:hypothetical protein